MRRPRLPYGTIPPAGAEEIGPCFCAVARAHVESEPWWATFANL